jgi:hypothetical protein
MYLLWGGDIGQAAIVAVFEAGVAAQNHGHRRHRRQLEQLRLQRAQLLLHPVAHVLELCNQTRSALFNAHHTQ